MTKEQAVEKVKAFMAELQKDGYNLEPVLRNNANALFADLQLRALTVEEMPKEKELKK